VITMMVSILIVTIAAGMGVRAAVQ